jgi:pimeloyl-ACP methyl ester carboxylesterase
VDTIPEEGKKKMIEEPRGRIDYDECGASPTIVLVPGSCSTGAGWRPVMATWNGQFRCITTNLLGYGGTVERRTAYDPDISHEAEILESVVRKASGRVHLVGHSFGGLVGLAVALRHRVSLASLAILEAPRYIRADADDELPTSIYPEPRPSADHSSVDDDTSIILSLA